MASRPRVGCNIHGRTSLPCQLVRRRARQCTRGQCLCVRDRHRRRFPLAHSPSEAMLHAASPVRNRGLSAAKSRPMVSIVLPIRLVRVSVPEGKAQSQGVPPWGAVGEGHGPAAIDPMANTSRRAHRHPKYCARSQRIVRHWVRRCRLIGRARKPNPNRVFGNCSAASRASQRKAARASVPY